MSEEEKKLFAPQLIQSLFPSGDDTLVRGILEDVQKKGTKNSDGYQNISECLNWFEPVVIKNHKFSILLSI